MLVLHNAGYSFPFYHFRVILGARQKWNIKTKILLSFSSFRKLQRFQELRWLLKHEFLTNAQYHKTLQLPTSLPSYHEIPKYAQGSTGTDHKSSEINGLVVLCRCSQTWTESWARCFCVTSKAGSQRQLVCQTQESGTIYEGSKGKKVL